MNKQGPFYEQIEDYLAGRLTPDQQTALRQALRDDPELAQELELRRLEFDVSEELIAGSIRDQLQRLRPAPSPDASSPPRANNIRRVRWLLAALLCIVAIGIYKWMARTPESTPVPLPPSTTTPSGPEPGSAPVPQAGNRPAPPPPAANRPAERRDAPATRYLALAAELYQKPDFESLRSATAPVDTALKTALNAWQVQDYAGVLTALQNLDEKNPKYLRAATLRAHAFFNLSRFGQAARSFGAIADSNIQPWAEDADGYVLLALLADGQNETLAFRKRLKKVLDDTGHPWHEMALTISTRLTK